MSRKSIPRKDISYWWSCEKCSIILTSKLKDLHQSCENSNLIKLKHFSYIQDHVLNTNKIGRIGIDVVNLNPSEGKLVVLVSESAMKICSFKIGKYVKISPKNNDFIPFIRKLWPISDDYLETVSFCDNGELKLIICSLYELYRIFQF